MGRSTLNSISATRKMLSKLACLALISMVAAKPDGWFYRPSHVFGRDPNRYTHKYSNPGSYEGRDASPGQYQGRDANPGQYQGRDANPGQYQGRDANPGQ